jgi:glycosyltransferase involved in cell wall biosynthesis
MNKLGQKKKILYVITKSNWGGAQRYTFDLATRLPKDEFEAVVAMGGTGELKQKLDNAGIRTITIPSLARDINIFNDALVFFALFKILQAERPGVIHLNSSKAAGIGILVSRLYNLSHFKNHKLQTKIVVTIHGLPHNEPRSWFIRQIIKLLTWFTILLSHHTITVSRHDRQQIIYWPLISKKVSVIHNGMGAVNFFERNVARRKLKKYLQINKNHSANLESFEACWIGTIAELHRNKGLDYLLEALGMIVETRGHAIAVIIGEGEERRNLEKYILDHGLSGCIFLAGHITDAASLLKAFDLFILPSVKEGFPYALLEAGAAGLPVIVTSVGGIPEIVEHESSGIIIPPQNPHDISAAFQYFFDNKEKVKILGNQLRTVVAKKHSVDNMLLRTVRIYGK